MTSQAERYTQWSESVRELFACPPPEDRRAVVESRTERNYRDGITHRPPQPWPCGGGPPSAAKPEVRPPLAAASIDDYFYQTLAPRPEPVLAPGETHYADEKTFPFCFYARMLSARQRRQPRGPAVPPSAECDTAECSAVGPDDWEVFSSVSQRFSMTEETAARHLAARQRDLQRERRAEERRRRQREEGPGDVAAAVFHDPTVERLQSELYADLTETLLHVRRRNAAAAELRLRLEHSRVVLSREHASAAAAAPSQPAADEDDDASETIYEDDFE